MQNDAQSTEPTLVRAFLKYFKLIIIILKITLKTIVTVKRITNENTKLKTNLCV